MISRRLLDTDDSMGALNRYSTPPNRVAEPSGEDGRLSMGTASC
jgi:hypothetical protein